MNEATLIFACAVTDTETESQACLLAESIRAHAGRYSDAPMWLLVERSSAGLSPAGSRVADQLGARVIPYEKAEIAQTIPLADKVFASAVAESLTRGQADFLVWMDPDSIIFQEPSALILEPGRAVGCRPVDHLLIGSPCGQPPDEFWKTIYRTCGVVEKQLFPMTTSVDEIDIRPYFNAGLLVVRPGIGLLQGWRNRFSEVLAAGIFEQFFQQDWRYKLFLHQAILSGVILSSLTQQQIQILTHRINFPLHMLRDYPTDRRPTRLNNLITVRYETFFDDKEWPQLLPSKRQLRDWLAQKGTAYGLFEG